MTNTNNSFRSLRSRTVRASLIAAAALLTLSACGGDRGSSQPQPPPPPPPPPVAPVLTVASDIKQLRFSWASVAGATGYRLLRNPDGASGFTQVGSDHAAGATSAQVDIAVHLHDWVNALYRLEACNAQGCTASTGVSALNAMIASIGYLKASNTNEGDLFGLSLALSGDGTTLAVGAPGEGSAATGVDGDQADNSAEFSGAVYVFTRAGNRWSRQAYLKASNTDENDLFGVSLALNADGTALAVGALGESSAATGVDGNQADNSAVDAGAVYVFTRSGNVWSQQAYLKASNTDELDRFGLALELSAGGDMLAVGAPGESSDATGIGGDQANNNAPQSGAVYVFTRAANVWSQQAYLKASNTDANDTLGFSLALALSADGTALAVGMPGESSAATGVGGNQVDNSALAAGAVYLFTRSGSVWSQQAYLKASNTDEIDVFGFSLALNADGITLAVGALGVSSAAIGVDGDQADDNAVSSGAVYVFTRSASVWSQQAYVKASNTDQGDSFGASLALSADGNTLVAGTDVEDSAATGVNGDQTDNSAPAAGAVYVY